MLGSDQLNIWVFLEAEAGSCNIYSDILRSKKAESVKRKKKTNSTQRDKVECRKPQLKSKPSSALCRQKLTEKDMRRPLSASRNCWEMDTIRKEGSTISWEPLGPVWAVTAHLRSLLLCAPTQTATFSTCS